MANLLINPQPSGRRLGLIPVWFAIMITAGCGSLGTEESAEQIVIRKPSPSEVARAVSSLTRDPKTAAQLKSLENRLRSSKEVEQYSKALPFMKTDEEKMEFLALDGFEERQLWLSNQNFPSRPNQTQDEMKELVENRDIALGMPQNLVRRSWGNPDSIEVSGDPKFKNERWTYDVSVSTPDGFRSEKKIVYFEGGKVVGWEVE